MMVIDQAGHRGFSLPVRFAALTHDLGKATTPADILPRHIGHEERSVRLTEQLVARLRVPADCRDLALIMARYHGNVHRAEELKPSTIVSLLEKTDALRRPARFQELLDACLCDYTGRLGWENKTYTAPERLLAALSAVNAVHGGQIAAACSDKGSIPQRIHAARIEAVKQRLNDPRD
jgi:tRNA nucleotidyltransferase (CCA-adding enzyme)